MSSGLLTPKVPANLANSEEFWEVKSKTPGRTKPGVTGCPLSSFAKGLLRVKPRPASYWTRAPSITQHLRLPTRHALGAETRQNGRRRFPQRAVRVAAGPEAHGEEEETAGRMLALQRAPKRAWRGLLCGQRRSKGLYGPKPHRGPLPRTPLTVRGPPPGAPLPWYLRKPPPVREQLPELDVVTYQEKMYFVPWLAKPASFPEWERGWHDPRKHRSPPAREMPAYKEQPCFLCNPRSRLQEGVKQALWLTKTKLVEGLPPQILHIMNDTAHEWESQDERVQNAISHALFWISTEELTPAENYCSVLLEDLLHLCRMMTAKYPSLTKRMVAQDHKVAAAWQRESILLQVRGSYGKILNATSPLQPIASKDEILATENHTLETFYPIAPTIDLQEVNVYEIKNDTGFREGYPYPYPHTVYFAPHSTKSKRKPEHLRAQMMMFAFGNALAKAKGLYGDEPRILDEPIVVQSVGTDGQCFQFLVFQLNTTDLDSSNGVKNLAWIETDQLLYEDARSCPEIKKKVVVKPAGIHGYHPDTFKKFLAFYLHGIV
nr:PREDICTED: 39S ribosomal protein L37, mitochondrial [Anolis carolinensis]|eukprot:XP_003220208.1 PREDICTED: 39S ribosomal protein L37, mitochondrial [Anolis carolinensis]